MDLHRLHFPTLDSTNHYLKRAIRAREFTRPTSVRADTQTAGVGRLGRAWASPPGGLWLSVALPIDQEHHDEILRGLSIRVGLRVVRAIESVATLPPAATLGLKWPNDILARRHEDDDWRKFAGVLIERISEPQASWLIVGVGVNANNDAGALPPQFRDKTTSIAGLGAPPVDLDALEAAVAEGVVGAINDDRFDALCLAAATRRLVNLFRPLTLEIPGGRILRGDLVGLSPITGSALIRSGDETLEAPAGSIIANV